MRVSVIKALLICFCLAYAGLARAQLGIEKEPSEDNPWFSYFMIEKALKTHPELKQKFTLSEDEAVKKIDSSLSFAYPKLNQLRPAGVIAGERDKRYTMIYRKMAWYVANDQVVAAQILFYSAVRLKQQELARGKELDLPYLSLHQFLYNALCVDFSADGEHEQIVCKQIQQVAYRAQAELRNQRLQQYLNWVALGLGFNDMIAYQAGVAMLDKESPGRNEKDIIKSILKPLLTKNAG